VVYKMYCVFGKKRGVMEKRFILTNILKKA
jgi:hypothetical protein